MRTLLLAAVILVVSAGDVIAQARCEDEDTLVACWQRYLPEPERIKEAAATNTTEEKLSLENIVTGVNTGGENLGSTVKNFLPLLSATGLVGDATTDNTTGTIVLDLNFLIPTIAKDNNSQLQAVVNPEPSLFPQLREALPEATREQRAEELKAGLSNLDDVSLSFTFGLMNRNFGRGFEQYRDQVSTLFEAVMNQTRASLAPELSDAKALFAFLAIVQDLQVSMDPDLQMKFSDIPEDVRATFKSRWEQAALDEAVVEAAMQKAIDESGLKYFSDLVNNQPQLYFSVERRFRDSLVGPSETKLRASWETGFSNLNSFEGKFGRGCRAVGAAGANPAAEVQAQCLLDFRQYIEDNKGRIEAGERLAISIEYSRSDEYDVFLPDDSVALSFDAQNKLIILAAFGRLFQLDQKATTSTRLDIDGRYEETFGDPTRNDRVVFSLTITRRFGNLTIPLGIVYANKPEFLGDVDQQLSANFGLKYQLFTGSD